MTLDNIQVSKWAFTLHQFDRDFNYKEYMESGDFDIKRAVLGYENSRTMNAHIQGYVEFNRTYRFHYVKTIFNDAHWERAVASPAQNYKYCTKSGAYETIGEWSTENTARNTSITGLILKGLLSRYAPVVKCSKEYMAKRKDYDSAADMLRHIRRQHSNFEKYKKCKLSNWQLKIFQMLQSQSERHVLWIVDSTGNKGKSFFCFFMDALYNYFISDGSLDARDLSFVLPEEFKGILFDLCRNMKGRFNYDSLESVKNGFLISGKYEGKIRRFNSVPTAVMANFPPDLSKLSRDRWQVITLGEDNFTNADNVGKYGTENILPYVQPSIMPDLNRDIDIVKFLQDHLCTGMQGTDNEQQSFRHARPLGKLCRFAQKA